MIGLADRGSAAVRALARANVSLIQSQPLVISLLSSVEQGQEVVHRLHVDAVRAVPPCAAPSVRHHVVGHRWATVAGDHAQPVPVGTVFQWTGVKVVVVASMSGLKRAGCGCGRWGGVQSSSVILVPFPVAPAGDGLATTVRALLAGAPGVVE